VGFRTESRAVFLVLALLWGAAALAEDGCGAATLCATFEPATTSFETNRITTDGGLRWWVGNKAQSALDRSRVELVGIGRDGSHALKITTQNDDRCVQSGSCNAHTFERSEINLDPAAPGASTGAVDGAEQWWAHSVYFPPEFQIRARPGAEVVILQFHNGGRQPAFVIEVYNQLGANAWKVFRARAQGPNGADNVGTQYSYLPRGAGKQKGQCLHDNVAEGVWYDFVHYIKWSSSGQGVHRIWMREGSGPVKKVLDQSRLSMIYPAGRVPQARPLPRADRDRRAGGRAPGEEALRLPAAARPGRELGDPRPRAPRPELRVGGAGGLRHARGRRRDLQRRERVAAVSAPLWVPW
jgi:hypothetical protein